MLNFMVKPLFFYHFIIPE